MKNFGINFYHFLPTHLSTILLRKHGPISKSISKRYCQVVVLFSRFFCPALVSIDYTKGKHLTIDSRRLIERWKKEGKSNREIASLLGKAPQTIHTEIKRGIVLQCVGKGRFKKVYSADYAQQAYESNRKCSVKKSSLTKELKEKILHYHNQKFSPEMMIKAKGVNVGISTIYYWIHHGKLGLTKQDLLYPRKGKSVKK